MGYTTTFAGQIKFNTLISKEVADLIEMQIVALETKQYICFCPWHLEKYNNTYVLVCGDGKNLEYIEWFDIILRKLSKIYVFSGTVLWRGEDYTDNGKIVVHNNVVTIYTSKYVKK